MSDGSSIEWLAWPGYRPASWNPAKGCTSVSEGCRNCYAEVMAARFSKPGQWGHGIAEMRGGDHRWTGRVGLDEAKLLLPLRWRSPRVIFVNSTSDLFHERLPDEAIDRVFAVMALCPQHRFIVLTKRAERMRAWVTRLSESDNAIEEICDAAVAISGSPCAAHIIEDVCMPLPNVILGVSVEDQATADERIPHLLATPAACRMVSAEPLLGPVDFTAIMGFLGASRADRTNIRERTDALRGSDRREYLRQDGTWNHRRLDDHDGNQVFSTNCGPRLGWIVTGGESGPGARPAHPDWFRSIRDQCRAAEVPFFFKQNGEWASWDAAGIAHGWDRSRIEGGKMFGRLTDGELAGKEFETVYPWATRHDIGPGMVRVGKHRAGRLLDGRTHDEVPEVSR